MSVKYYDWAANAENIMYDRMYAIYRENCLYQPDEYFEMKELARKLLVMSMQRDFNAAS